eukprot:2777373-Ditylum_brightwellii.AAC.1
MLNIIIRRKTLESIVVISHDNEMARRRNARLLLKTSLLQSSLQSSLQENNNVSAPRPRQGKRIWGKDAFTSFPFDDDIEHNVWHYSIDVARR